jgi:hypothetical protein
MNNLRIKKLRRVLLVAGVVVLTLVVVVVTRSIRKNTDSVRAESVYISQETSKADFISDGEFLLRPEQDEDTPLKILEAKVQVISGDRYHELTSQLAPFREIISVPRVVLQNVSNKTVVGIGLIICDKGANIKRGIYIKEQSIKPGQEFTILPENFVRVGGNPAKNSKFWVEAADKSQVVVRVVAFFDDGSMWANKDQRY